jgi:DNA-binding beta-propeller fold protein YncE
MSIARLMQQAAAGVAGAGPEPSGWTDPDLANASYDSVSFSVSGQDTSPRKVFFKPDGTKMYVAGSTGRNVYEYDLSTAWDITSATFLQSFSVSTEETDLRGLYFESDGTEMYIIGSGGDDVNQYSLSTAWDVSSASFLQAFSVATQETSPQGLFFKPDGTQMFVVGIIGDSVYEYALSTAWDVSTASHTQSFSVISQAPFVTDVFFNPDGNKMWVIGQTSDAVSQYSLSTAWDVSTSVYDSVVFSVSSQETAPQGFFFKPDGSKMYVVGTTNDTIYQYSTA